MADKTTQTIYIDADPVTVMDVIADIGSYPEWVAEYKTAEVLETDAQGNPKTARMVLDAGAIKDNYVLEYDWKIAEDGTGSVSWHLVRATLLKGLNGSYTLAPVAAGTKVTYDLEVELTMPMIGLLKRKAERRLTDTALKDLKKRAEAE